MKSSISLAHIQRTDTWNSGGGILLDIVELDDGLALVISDDTLALYRSVDDFWSEVGDGDSSHRTTTILRASGRPEE